MYDSDFGSAAGEVRPMNRFIHPSNVVKRGIVVLPKSPVVVRSFGWMARFRRWRAITLGGLRRWSDCISSLSRLCRWCV